jgi:molybdate transport system substrate-binding protein
MASPRSNWRCAIEERVKIDSHLHHPIEQALAIVASSPRIEQAKEFRSFLLGPEGRTILANNGYLLP